MSQLLTPSQGVAKICEALPPDAAMRVLAENIAATLVAHDIIPGDDGQFEKGMASLVRSVTETATEMAARAAMGGIQLQ